MAVSLDSSRAIGGIDRGVTVPVQQLRRAAEQLSPDAHRRSLECLTQGRWRGKRPALKPEQSPDSVHFLRPIDDLLELRFHMFAEVEQDGMFPAGNGFADWMTQLHHCGASKLLSERSNLFTKPKSTLLIISLSRFNTVTLTTYPCVVSGFN